MNLGRKVIPDGSLRRDLAELQRLVRVLERHAPVNVADGRRDLELLGGGPAGGAEPHLRAVAALLVTLESFQRMTARCGGRSPTDPAGAVQAAPSLNGRPVNGGPVNGQRVNGRSGDPIPTSGRPDVELAAAAARYIARDLAARQLSEFTSAEGYRLARALSRIGRVEAQVEQLLADANQVRLHPLPLADALSHSPR